MKILVQVQFGELSAKIMGMNDGGASTTWKAYPVCMSAHVRERDE